MSSIRLPSTWTSEASATVRLALPLVAGQLAAVGMNVVDSLLAGRHGATTLAGVAVGSALWSVVILILIGVLMAIPPSVSQLVGAGKRHEVGALFRQAVWLALALGTLLGGCVWFGVDLLVHLGIDPEIVPVAAAFLRALAGGAPALALFFCFRYTSEGLGLSRPTMIAGIAGLLALVPLGYVLMFGAFGWPGAGAGGLGAATAIVLWLQAAGLAQWLTRAGAYRDLALWGARERPRWSDLANLLRLGLPMGVTIMMEGGLFVAAGVLIGGLGTQAAAAHQIAINVASVCFMVPLGIAMASTVRVGFASGADDVARVRRAAWVGLLLVLGTQGVSAATVVLFAAPIAAAYTPEPAVVALGAQLLAIAAIFQLSDGLQAAAAGALRGLKDTRRPMFLTAFAYWGVGMPTGAWLAFEHDLGSQGIWWGLAVGLTAAAVLLGVRLGSQLAHPARWRPTFGTVA